MAAATTVDEASAQPAKGDRISIYWTEMDTWYNGTYKCCRNEQGDDGRPQRSSCILYDAVDEWSGCTARQLTYWHCLDDENWRQIEHAE